MQARNSGEMCAERKLLSMVKESVRRKTPFPTVADVKRAVGTVVVERRRRDGSAGCSLPCMECRRALSEVDAHILCVDSEGEWLKCRARDLPIEGGVVTLADKRRWGRV